MWFRHLTVSAACAALLGLAAAGLVRIYASEIVSAMTRTTPRAAQADENGATDGGVPSAVGSEPEATMPMRVPSAAPYTA